MESYYAKSTDIAAYYVEGAGVFCAMHAKGTLIEESGSVVFEDEIGEGTTCEVTNRLIELGECE